MPRGSPRCTRPAPCCMWRCARSLLGPSTCHIRRLAALGWMTNGRPCNRCSLARKTSWSELHHGCVKTPVLMKLVIALTAVAACAVPDDPIDEGTVEQAGTTIQGTTIQGTTIQGTTIQGTTIQGTTIQGTTIQGTYGGSVASAGGVAGTALWFQLRLPDGTLETHWPNKLCTRAPG